MTTRSSLPVAELARRCAEAMARFQRQKANDPSSCYELFQRALEGRDQEAWSALYGQYHRLVRRWLGKPPGDLDALVNEVFARLWRAIPAECFGEFPTVQHFLAYLKRCARSVAMDDIRREERSEKVIKELIKVKELALVGSRSYSLELMQEHLLERPSDDQLYEYVLSRLKGRKERLVFRDSHELGLPPREIAKRWPDLFADAKDVSRVKERILRRLRRDDQLKAIWETLFHTAEKPRHRRSMVWRKEL